jgi:predicted PurR-regulated permease PerM
MSAEPVRAPPLSRPVTILAGLAAAFLVMAGVQGIAGILGPAFLALVLTIGVHPLHGWVQRRGLPGWIGTVVGLVAVYAFLVGLAVSFGVAMARFAALLPSYQDEMSRWLDRTLAWLASLGLDQQQIESIAGQVDVGKVVTLVGGLASSVLGWLSSLFFVVTLLLFMMIDAAGFGQKLLDLPAERRPLARALSSFASGTRRYIVVSTVFGLVVAVIDTWALMIIGVPVALLWGLLSFITNYIPNIGFVIGLVPPAIIGLLEGGPGMMLAVVVAYSVINVAIQTVLQPKIVGDVVGLSTTLTMLSLVFWAAVLGVIGALMAVPLTLLVKALLVDADPDAAWLQPLLSADSRPSKDLRRRPRTRGRAWRS